MSTHGASAVDVHQQSNNSSNATQDLGLYDHSFIENPYQNMMQHVPLQAPFTFGNVSPSSPYVHHSNPSFTTHDIGPHQPPTPPYSGHRAPRYHAPASNNNNFFGKVISDPSLMIGMIPKRKAAKDGGQPQRYISSDDDLFVDEYAPATTTTTFGDLYLQGASDGDEEDDNEVEETEAITRANKRSTSKNLNRLASRRKTKAKYNNFDGQIANRKGKTSNSRNRTRARKPGPEADPENRLIMQLRTEEHASWPEIVATLNRQRLTQGKPPNVTEAAVYGRFKRNAPRIAEAYGIIGFDYQDYMHMTPLKNQEGAHAPRMGFRLGRLESRAEAQNVAGRGQTNALLEVDGGDGQHGAMALAGSTSSMIFTHEEDMALMDIYNVAMQGMWLEVTREMSERTGRELHDNNVATRVGELQGAHGLSDFP